MTPDPVINSLPIWAIIGAIFIILFNGVIAIGVWALQRQFKSFEVSVQALTDADKAQAATHKATESAHAIEMARIDREWRAASIELERDHKDDMTKINRDLADFRLYVASTFTPSARFDDTIGQLFSKLDTLRKDIIGEVKSLMDELHRRIDDYHHPPSGGRGEQ